MIEVYNLTEEERKIRTQKLMDKLMNSGLDNTKRNTKWKNKEFVRTVIQEYLHFLLVERNKKLSNLEGRGVITEKEAFEHLEKTYNFRNKPNVDKTRDIMGKLDEDFSVADANYILKSHGKICNDSMENLEAKLKAISDYNYQEAIANTPQKLRASATWIKARLAYYTEMIRIGKETRNLSQIPASELLSDKDKFSEGNGKHISEARKATIKAQYNGERS